MMRGPPQRSLLRAGRAEHGEHELEGAARLVRAMREVPVVPRGHGDHPHRVQPERERETSPRKPEPCDANDGGDLHGEEGDRREADRLRRVVVLFQPTPSQLQENAWRAFGTPRAEMTFVCYQRS